MNIRRIAKYAASKGRAAQHSWELQQALTMVHAWQPKIVMEIGSYKGWSMWAWAQVLPPGTTLISVDLQRRSREGTDWVENPEFQKHFEGFETHFIRGNSMFSEVRDKVVEALDGRTIDFLFIDGGHRYKTVKSDYEMYCPLVDGIIGFHDMAHDGKTCRVIDLWQELRPLYVHKEFVLETSKRKTMGIGMIWHKGESKWAPLEG